MNEQLSDILIWRRPDGTFLATVFSRKAMKPGQSEDDFIFKEVQMLKLSKPELQLYTEFKKTKEDVDLILKDQPDDASEKMKIRPDGIFFLDQTVKTEKEKRLELTNSIKTKLGLSEDEIKILIR